MAIRVYCNQIEDISALSAIISNGYLCAVEITSDSSIQLTIDRECKENVDNSRRFRQLCIININNTVNNKINSYATGVIRSVSGISTENKYILSFHLYIPIKSKYGPVSFKGINFKVIVNNIFIELESLAEHRLATC